MIVRHDNKKVDVVDASCPIRTCFRLGQDKGSFVQGRGYTNYHKAQKWVCMRRHLHGCPTEWVCEACRYGQLPLTLRCRNCGSAKPNTTQ